MAKGRTYFRLSEVVKPLSAIASRAKSYFAPPKTRARAAKRATIAPAAHQRLVQRATKTLALKNNSARLQMMCTPRTSERRKLRQYRSAE